MRAGREQTAVQWHNTMHHTLNSHYEDRQGQCVGLSHPHTLETPKLHETEWPQSWHPGHIFSTLEQEGGQEAPDEFTGLCFLNRGVTDLAEENPFEGLYPKCPLPCRYSPLLCTLQAKPHQYLAMAPSIVTNELTKAVTCKNQKI